VKNEAADPDRSAGARAARALENIAARPGSGDCATSYLADGAADAGQRVAAVPGERDPYRFGTESRSRANPVCPRGVRWSATSYASRESVAAVEGRDDQLNARPRVSVCTTQKLTLFSERGLHSMSGFRPGSIPLGTSRPFVPNRADALLDPERAPNWWDFQRLLQAADGTRTHDLLHGNRLGNPHKRLLLRISTESDYRRLARIRRCLVPQWSPGGLVRQRLRSSPGRASHHGAGAAD
jgi:hypothetical protein